MTEHKIDSQRLTDTNQLYLQLEIDGINDELNRMMPKCRLNLPQAPLVPYSEPTVYDGNLLK